MSIWQDIELFHHDVGDKADTNNNFSDSDQHKTAFKHLYMTNSEMFYYCPQFS